MKILFLEDDPVLGDIVSSYLNEFYDITHAFDAREAEIFIDNNHYDLFIFDINIPIKNGIELLKDLRDFNNTTPAIIVTAYGDIKYLKASFDAGAHDYIRKPFDLEELKIRIEKSRLLFHIEQDLPIKLSLYILYYPKEYYILNKNKKTILRPKEVQILNYFISNPHRIISQEELFQNIWEFDSLPSDATLRSYIRKLRELIGASKITTQRGVGYRYE